jgi:hypothetical protein
MRRPGKIMLGEMRAGRGGTRALLVYCLNPRCSHMTRIAPSEADKWPDDVRLSDLEPKFICSKCGQRGADVRPDFNPPKMGTGNS